jgi:hypothetical protein
MVSKIPHRWHILSSEQALLKPGFHPEFGGRIDVSILWETIDVHILRAEWTGVGVTVIFLSARRSTRLKRKVRESTLHFFQKRYDVYELLLTHARVACRLFSRRRVHGRLDAYMPNRPFSVGASLGRLDRLGPNAFQSEARPLTDCPCTSTLC